MTIFRKIIKFHLEFMKFRNLLLLITGMFFGQFLSAQDIHFTQFYMVPQGLNPALAGKFEGSVRLGGIYRSQWRSILGNNNFSTPSAFVDAPIMKGFRKKDWVGVGLSLFHDKVGTVATTHSGARIGPTYHIALDSKRNNVLSLGYAFGGEQRALSLDGAKFFDALPPGSPQSADLLKVDTTKKNYNDHQAGIVLSSKLNKQMDMNIGFAIFHLGRPKVSLMKSGLAKLARRTVLHGQFNIQTSKTMTITPQFIFQNMSGANEIAVQTIAGFLFDPKKGIYIDGGVGYRLRDAVELIGGVRIKNLKVGIAYDVNTSSLRSETSRRGGFEIGVNYMVRIYKAPVRKQQVLCPRF
jgi:type IX secretion system PorP/SprF family membrane protein